MARLNSSSLPFLGAGLGYRRPLDAFLRAQRKHLGFLEIMPEHVVEGSAESRAALLELAAEVPCVTHAVSLSVGTATGADLAFVPKMHEVNQRVDAAWASDHLCYTKIGKQSIGQLTPIPYTEEALDVVVRNVRAVQAGLDRPFLLENISQYFQFKGTDFDEPTFFREVVARTGCGVLLDVTNLRNNAVNLGLRPKAYLDEFPLESVVQLHLAGSERIGGKLLDTHGGPIHDDVWALAERVVATAPVRAALIERDQDFEPLSQLAEELRRTATLMRKAEAAA